jgi:hypothetical protein
MAKACFCGCDRPIRLSSRKLNRQGALLTQLLMGVHALVLPKLDPEPGLSDSEREEVEQARASMERFADEGTLLRSGLIDVLHDEASIRTFDHARMLAWIAVASDLNEQATRDG